MYEFIVLGQIPGTHFQITFQGWQMLVVLVAAAYIARRIYRNTIALRFNRPMHRPY